MEPWCYFLWSWSLGWKQGEAICRSLLSLWRWSQHSCNQSSAITATSELTQQLDHLFHQQLFHTSHKRSCSPHDSGICSVVEAGRREVAEALQSQRLMLLPQQEGRKGHTEAQHHLLVQTPQKPQFSGVGCCTVWKLHIYGLILYCSVL